MMVSFAQPAIQSNKVSSDLKVALKRISVFDLFQQYVPILSGLPGGTSQFDQTDIGFEWHCEFEIGAGLAEDTCLQIHFHLIDLEPLAKPAAVLYLVEFWAKKGKQNRLTVPLEDLTETHERLNEHLAGRGASIEAFENANNFIVALTQVRESLLSEVDWV
jgi:hypothetical protein